MSDESIGERRFTDKEVREILKRSVEGPPSQALVKRDGLTLAELKSIGAEVGIDPSRLEDAARELVRTDGSRSNWIVGSPTVLRIERSVEGVFDPAEAPRILSVIRRTMGQQGEVSQLHGSLEWSVKGETGERLVTVSSTGGKTTVTGSANLTNAAIMTYLPAGLLGVFASIVGLTQAADAESQIGLIFFAAMIPLLYLMLRTILGRITGSTSAKLQLVVDELARLAALPEGDPDGSDAAS